MFDVCTTDDTAHIDTIFKFSRFPVAVNNSIRIGPLVFLLQIFVIKDNIMKRPVLLHA
jgi:hypothetical protein